MIGDCGLTIFESFLAQYSKIPNQKSLLFYVLNCLILFKAFNPFPHIKLSFALLNPSCIVHPVTVDIANPALAQTTLFCGSVPFPLNISEKI
jgi:hypothetical protein